MGNHRFFLLGLLLTGGLASCSQQDVGITDEEIFQSNKADIERYASSKGLSTTATASGLYYAVKQPSSSTVTPAVGQEVEFTYTLSVLSNNNGTVTDRFVDSAYATRPRYLHLANVSSGLSEGLARMREGEQAILLLPSVYAFGRDGAGNGVVPPNAPVRIDVLLRRTRTEDQQINEYLTANNLRPTEVTVRGVRFIKTLSIPTGAAPSNGQRLSVRYRGQLLREKSAFDSTGTGLYTTTIGQSVAGFDEGLSKLRVGEKATIIFPSAMGYGSSGRGTIPPYAPMRFDIELVSAQ
ncbi:FKBP-type peptidyl-prolyl cis-trans isomerase [Spirosoma montaniterrae]|uniref:Peptidyl-prolyl cis-trans isomerase n=1 Tax=Spirosoma montaniterrae TaxID=1178516 RepID=A0A1P9X1Y5_9BACT|nr:FKBP-type peptidyl-prolyl cis-trans isomerase [Spirosoma montaniterrae]AQG81644.1 FKBP-type peptidylprolyl isomerase [Spirosoma montaniterrae]